MTKHLTVLAAFLAFVLLSGVLPAPAAFHFTGAAYADPPSWAPAHGWRAKHRREPDEYHEYYNDDDSDYVYHHRTVRVETLPLIESHPYVEITCSNKPILGTIVGGTAGGLIGNQFGKGNGKTAATVSGVLLGAVIGNSIGVDMSRQDSDCMAQALEYGRPGTQVAWKEDNAAYTVLPERDFRDDEGQYCREYQTKIIVDGRTRSSYGTACRQPDGQWHIIK